MEVYALLRLAFEAMVGSSWPELFCFEAPGDSEVVSLQVVQVKSVPDALVSVGLAVQPVHELPRAAGLDIDAFLVAAAQPAVPASAASVVVVLASAPAVALLVFAAVA